MYTAADVLPPDMNKRWKDWEWRLDLVLAAGQQARRLTMPSEWAESVVFKPRVLLVLSVDGDPAPPA